MCKNRAFAKTRGLARPQIPDRTDLSDELDRTPFLVIIGVDVAHRGLNRSMAGQRRQNTNTDAFRRQVRDECATP